MSPEINKFFGDNHQLLTSFVTEYSNVYNYNQLNSDEFIADLLIFTYNKESRIDKLLRLINTTAKTISTVYKYSTEAVYYLKTIIWRTVKAHRTFENNMNRKKLELIYLPYLEDTIIDNVTDEIHESDYFKEGDVFKKAKQLSKQKDNWWKYEIWQDKYIDKMTYKELAEKYDLTTTPIFYIIREYNQQIKVELLKHQDRKTLI